MKRRISIFVFLLSAFAAVGSFSAEPATKSIILFSNYESTFIDCYGAGSPYETTETLPTEPKGWSISSGYSIYANVKSGYRFLGWYTKKTGWTGSATANTTDSEPFVTTQQITYDQILTAGTSENSRLTIVAKYVPIYTITTAVSPEGAGTVSGGGTVEEGGSVTLTATAYAGWEFSKWSDGNTDPERKIEKISKDETYTAQFIAKGYSVSKQPENATITVAESGTYNEDLEITWKSEGAAGYDYTFVSAQVLDGNTVLATYMTGTSALFNMKNTCGQYHSSVKVVVKYTKTGQNRNLKLTFSTGIAQIGYKIGAANAWTLVSAGTTVSVPVGTQWQAYAVPVDGYTTSTSETSPQSGTMGANGAEFAPTAELDGYKLTVDPNGDPQKKDAKFHNSGELYTYSNRLRPGMSTLNELDDVATKDDGSELIEYRDLNGEAVYDAQGRYIVGTYWDRDGNFQGKDNLTVKAIWGPPPEHCTIRAVCDPTVGGTVEPASTNVVKGKDVTLTATANTGYSFCCWTNETGSCVSSDKQYTFQANTDATYTAVFTGNVYTVKFRNSGEKKVPTKQVTFGKSYGDLPVFTDDKLVLEGWYTEDEGQGTKILPTTIVTTPRDHDLYANWIEKTDFNAVFVDKDGANGAITNQVTKGDVISDPPEKTANWKREYYTLIGWNPPLPQIVDSSDLEFTAIWRSVSDVLDCTNLRFNAVGNWEVCTNDQVVGDSCMKLPKSDGDDLLSATIAEPGTLRFNWKVDENAELVVSTNGVKLWLSEGHKPAKWSVEQQEVIELSSPCELLFYCVQGSVSDFCKIDNVSWEPGTVTKKHDVTFTDPSGTFKTNVVTVDEGAAAKAPNWMSDKFDPTVCGWSKDFSKVMEDIEVSAVWTCRVEFVDREMATTNKVAYWDSVEAPTDLKPYPGYTHTGWNPELPEHVESNLVLTAVWTPNDEYTVTYRPGTGISGSTMTQSEKKGVAVRLYDKDKAYERTGYSQDGWAVTDDGIKAFEFGTTYDRNVSTNLYPCWTNNRYTVTFDANGGSAAPAPKTVTFDNAYGDLPSPGERANYKFDGWALASGNTVTAETIVKTAADHKLTAKWTQDLGPYSKALDCENLEFKVSSGNGWKVHTDGVDKLFAKKNGSCLADLEKNEEVFTTINESGKLKFWWKCMGETGTYRMRAYTNGVEISALDMNAYDEETEWKEEEIQILASAPTPVTLIFKCTNVATDEGYCAIDYVTWTPDQAHPVPEPGDAVTISSAAVSDGKFILSFQSDERFDYNLLTNGNLLIKSWGILDTFVGDGSEHTFTPAIRADQPQLFYRVDTIQKK